jgi:integrase
VIEELLEWHPVCGYPKPEDWIFASHQTFGKMPMWPDSLRRKILQPLARKVGIRKQIGWHTFRRTYSSLLAETGNDVKVVQELMRHAKLSTTMEVYTQAACPKSGLRSGRPSMCSLTAMRRQKRGRAGSVLLLR